MSDHPTYRMPNKRHIVYDEKKVEAVVAEVKRLASRTGKHRGPRLTAALSSWPDAQLSL